MKAEKRLLENAPEDRKLVVIIGENHGSQMHAFFQHGNIIAHADQQALKPHLRYAVGEEIPHTHLEKPGIFSRFNNIKARRAFLSYCRDEGISVGFNDIAARSGMTGHYIDQRDAFTRAVVQKEKPDLEGKNILRSSRTKDAADGIALSNAAMVARSMDEIGKTGAKIYFVHCGIAHVMGHKKYGFSYEDSLTKRFMDKGCAVLPVFLGTRGKIPELPENAQEMMSRSIVVTGLSAETPFSRYGAVRRKVNRDSGFNL